MRLTMKTNKLYNYQAALKIIIVIVIMLMILMQMSGSAKANDATLQERLEKLSQKLEIKRQEFHIPGMAMAIVKDNKIIYTKGFGVSDLDKKTLVTGKTVFGIGSTTKAFTATLIAMLVDEGKIQWDDPVTKYLPYLQFNMENITDEITLRDMMSHQTGFTRFNLLYANGKVGRDEILHAAIKAEPWAGFREKFLYTNLMVSGAGVAAAKSIDTDWESLLDNRLLQPLGMKNTTSRYEKVQQDPLLSKGYTWLQEQGKHKQLNMHNITNIGPAGAISSNVEDMAKWLQLQLGKGTFNGKRIVSERQIQETRKPQIAITPDAHYGLGWMLREYRGQKLVAHDGSVEGYSAIVALLPESNIGFVLLTNVTTTGLLGVSMNLVWETLLNKPQEEIVLDTTKGAPSYETYVGEYIANFAAFKDTIFSFHTKDGTAYIDVPGQMDYELKPPDKHGKMYFVVTDTISISFDKDMDENIIALRMQQGGMNFELPKKGVPIVAEVTPEELQKFMGNYTSKLFKGEIKVIIQNRRLTVDVPGQMAFELHLPDTMGHRHFRIKDSMSIVFEKDVKESVIALSVYKDDAKLDTAPKVATKNSDNLPSVADIMKLRQTEKRKKALLSSGGFRLKGKITMAQSGVAGKVISTFQGYDQFREEVDLGQYGSIITALNKEGAATAPSFASFTEHHGKYLEQIQNMHPAALIDWQHYYEKIRVVGTSTLDDKKVYILKLNHGKLPTSTIFVDAQTGDVLRQQIKMLNPTMGMIPVTTIFENYQEINGLRIPHKVTVKNDFNGKSIIELDSFETNLTFNPNTFILINSASGE